jgi:hypothetical protein
MINWLFTRYIPGLQVISHLIAIKSVFHVIIIYHALNPVSSSECYPRHLQERQILVKVDRRVD